LGDIIIWLACYAADTPVLWRFFMLIEQQIAVRSASKKTYRVAMRGPACSITMFLSRLCG
jgi:hypothetical protein